MITKFKLFEDKNYYVDKFFLVDVYMREYSHTKGDFHIILSKGIYEKNQNHPIDDDGIQRNIHIDGDSFTVMKNGDIKEPSGWGYTYSKKELDNIEFMTASEFFNKDPELCEKLFLTLIDKSKNDSYLAEWYKRMIKYYLKVLSTIPEFEHYVDSIKYNL